MRVEKTRAEVAKKMWEKAVCAWSKNIVLESLVRKPHSLGPEAGGGTKQGQVICRVFPFFLLFCSYVILAEFGKSPPVAHFRIPRLSPTSYFPLLFCE